MNKNLMEKRIHGEADFPISFYEQSFAADEEVLAPLHYHAEMEVLVAKKGKIFTMHWRGGYLTKEVLDELIDLIQKAGEEKQKKAKISLNWSQAVLRFTFAEELVMAEITMEDANEGEQIGC